jgi:hypothetical protein
MSARSYFMNRDSFANFSSTACSHGSLLSWYVRDCRYHHGRRWTDKFQHVVGVMHTNYLDYARREEKGHIKEALLRCVGANSLMWTYIFQRHAVHDMFCDCAVWFVMHTNHLDYAWREEKRNIKEALLRCVCISKRSCVRAEASCQCCAVFVQCCAYASDVLCDGLFVRV